MQLSFIVYSYRGDTMRFKLIESIVTDLEPGRLYWFNAEGGIRSGVYKGSTKAWRIFVSQDDSRNYYVNLWSNIATSKEDLEMIDSVVDRIEKDTKVPKTMHLPNRFI